MNFGTKLLKKSSPAKTSRSTKVARPKTNTKRSFPRTNTTNRKVSSQPILKGGAGYRKYQGDALWLPNTTRPSWLDGTLPGDRGFDPLGLAKPVEYLQFDLDQLDQNQAQNKAD